MSRNYKKAVRSTEQKLARGLKNLTCEEEDYAETIAFDASKDLARHAEPEELNSLAINALKYFEIDAFDHSTWAIHDGNCDGSGRSCKEGSENAIVERAMIALEQREQREEWKNENMAALASGDFEPGQTVSLWGGNRIGVIMKHNKVSAKVKMIGLQSEKYSPRLKSIKPHFMSPISPRPLPAVGESLSIKCHDGHTRNVTVQELDYPLFKVSYSLKNGEGREAWFDPTSLPIE